MVQAQVQLANIRASLPLLIRSVAKVINNIQHAPIKLTVTG